MVLNTQTQDKSYGGQPSPVKAKSFNWKELKKHALLVIAGVCLWLWWKGSSGKVSWGEGVSEWLPFIGGLALVGEQLFKLV